MAAVLDEIIGLNGWADLGPAIKETLNLLLLTYVRSERIEGDSSAKREEIAFHMYMLNSLMDTLKKVETDMQKEEAA
jgi:hypothetical protein